MKFRLQQNFFPDKTIIETIYFGGGTPSLLSSKEINELLNEINKYFSVSSNPEITIEANPDDLSRDYLSTLKKRKLQLIALVLVFNLFLKKICAT